MIMTKQEACDFFARYGGVTSDVAALKRVQPTAAQLTEAASSTRLKLMAEVEDKISAAVKAMRTE